MQRGKNEGKMVGKSKHEHITGGGGIAISKLDGEKGILMDILRDTDDRRNRIV
jgi:hypothetical protein